MRYRCRILAFHQTSGRFYPGINNITHRDIDSILKLVEDWGFTWHEFFALDKILADETAAIVTFDDGYEDNLPMIDSLIAGGAAPAVFIPTAYIGKQNEWDYSSRFFPARHLDRNQIRRLADRNVIIGSHGVAHRSLTAMMDGMLRRELAESKAELEDITGRPVNDLSFPFGRTSRRVNAIALECGYRRGFLLGEMDNIEFRDEEFVVPRIPIYGADDYFSLKGKLLRDSSRERLKNRIINMLAAGTIIVRGRLK